MISTLLKSFKEVATARTSWALNFPGIFLLLWIEARESTMVVHIHLEIEAARSSLPTLLSLKGVPALS